MPTFTPTKRIFVDSQILSHWYHFEAQLVGNNIWKKISILSPEIFAILICIYESKIWVIRFSSHTIQRTKSPPQSHLALRKYSSTKSYYLCYLKAMAVGLSVATMCGNVHNFVWLPWQPFKARTSISWGLFVTTSRIPNYCCITLLPCRDQAIIWTNAGMLLFRPSGRNFGEILIEMYTLWFRKVHLKLSSAKLRRFCPGLNALKAKI